MMPNVENKLLTDLDETNKNILTDFCLIIYVPRFLTIKSEILLNCETFGNVFIHSSRYKYLYRQ